MEDYISRQKLIDKITSMRDSSSELSVEDHIYGLILNLINSMPKENIQEVKLGHWNVCSDGYYPICSECKQEPDTWRKITNYCPHCGAKNTLR